ncbi:MAG: hypothetical protein OXH03_03675 [Bacteroidetes bacterium]|nr:hypothetical protein [Bacteroidota bacterium]
MNCKRPKTHFARPFIVLPRFLEFSELGSCWGGDTRPLNEIVEYQDNESSLDGLTELKDGLGEV